MFQQVSLVFRLYPRDLTPPCGMRSPGYRLQPQLQFLFQFQESTVPGRAAITQSSSDIVTWGSPQTHCQSWLVGYLITFMERILGLENGILKGLGWLGSRYEILAYTAGHAPMVQVHTKPPYTSALAYPSGHSPKSRSETPRLTAIGVNPHIGIPSTLLNITLQCTSQVT